MRLFFAFAAIAALFPLDAASGAPLDAEIKQSIEKGFTAVYVDPTVWRITKIRCEFGPAKVGKLMQKQVQYGKNAEPVWPVKIEVKVIQYKDGKEYKTVVRGVASDDVFFFYRDAFDEWQFKTGSL